MSRSTVTVSRSGAGENIFRGAHTRYKDLRILYMCACVASWESSGVTAYFRSSSYLHCEFTSSQLAVINSDTISDTMPRCRVHVGCTITSLRHLLDISLEAVHGDGLKLPIIEADTDHCRVEYFSMLGS